MLPRCGSRVDREAPRERPVPDTSGIESGEDAFTTRVRALTAWAPGVHSSP